jgi:hypothetical protein
MTAAHLRQPVDDVAGVGDHDIDAVHLTGRKHQPGVDDQQIVVRFQHEHILADLAQPTQGDDAQQARAAWLSRLFFVLPYA